MLKKFALVCVSLLLLGQSASAAVVPPESRTLYWFAGNSWGVGTLTLGKPMTFRDGRILVFPAQFVDLLWAPKQTKPRNMMLVYEVATDDEGSPLFKQHDEIFAPIHLLPDHSYWRENLPNTRRHEVAGGRRYVFRGEEIPEVRALLAAYFDARKQPGLERWKAEIRAVASGLGSKIAVVREDSARQLSIWKTLARDVDDEALGHVADFLRGEAPLAEKQMVIDAFAKAKVTGLAPVLSDLAAGDDGTAAAAISGLAELGQPASTERLVALSRSGNPEMQAYASGALGRRAATDEAARERCREILASQDAAPGVLVATTEGLGDAGGEEVEAILADAVGRAGVASRPAGEALARIGTPGVVRRLSGILTENEGEAALAAAAALGRVPRCAECAGILRQQRKEHADPRVRDLIGVVLEVPVEHKH